MKKSLIIGACSEYEWPQIAPWVLSANRCGFVGDKIMIVFRGSYDTVMKLFDNGFQAIVFGRDEATRTVSYKSPNRIYIERFFQIYKYLESTWQDYEYVITTDTRDVIFQTDPVAWLRDNIGDKQIVAASEGIRFRDEDWCRKNFFETYGLQLYGLFQDKEIYNVGTLAGRSEGMRDLMLNLFSAGVNRLAPITDQSVYNMIIQSPPYKEAVKFAPQDEGWACQAGSNADPAKLLELREFLTDKPPIFEGGLVKNSAGKVYPIVHQYDRVPLWKEHFLKEYGA